MPFRETGRGQPGPHKGLPTRRPGGRGGGTSPQALLGHWWEPPQERCRGSSRKGRKWGRQSITLPATEKASTASVSSAQKGRLSVHGLAPSPSFSWEPDSPQIIIHFTAPGQDTRSTRWRVGSPAFISQGGNVWHTAPASLQKGG